MLFHQIRSRERAKYICVLLTKLVRSRWLGIGQVLFLRFYGPRRSRDLLYGFMFKLKLQQRNKTEHETVLLGKKFFIAGRYKIYFQCIFRLACNHGKQNCRLKPPLLNIVKISFLPKTSEFYRMTRISSTEKRKKKTQIVTFNK